MRENFNNFKQLLRSRLLSEAKEGLQRSRPSVGGSDGWTSQLGATSVGCWKAAQAGKGLGTLSASFVKDVSVTWATVGG